MEKMDKMTCILQLSHCALRFSVNDGGCPLGCPLCSQLHDSLSLTVPVVMMDKWAKLRRCEREHLVISKRDPKRGWLAEDDGDKSFDYRKNTLMGEKKSS